MSQKSLFTYFTQKKVTTPNQSPVAKKQTAIRSLQKISKKAEESDLEFEISDASSSESDEQDFKKVMTEKKLMKSNKPPAKLSKVASSSDDSEGFVVSDEEERKPKTKTKAKPGARSKSSSVNTNFETSAAEIAKSASASVNEEDLPEWLSSKLMDAEKRKPNSEGYDPTSVFIPPSAEAEFTPFQKQFWEIKRKNFDAIVMIRKGKFYEMFSVDALFARDYLKLHLTWRGKEPMCGVPEKAFSEWAVKIVNAGKRVCKVEQMETAVDQRNRKDGGKAIIRELVQVYSLGTIDDFEMLESSQPSFLMSLRSSGRSHAGLCLVDCSTGSFHMGVVNEDDLADTLIRFEPVEVIYHSDSICQEHLAVIKHYCGSVATRAKGGADCWDGLLSLNYIRQTAQWEEIPDVLEKFPKEAIAALGGCVSYLHEHKIAKSLLSLQRFSTLDEAGGSNFLSLDSSALTNLQIIGKDDHCLLKILDRCVTPFGKRRLRFWLMHPLRNQSIIEDRLDAVEELMSPEMSILHKKLTSIPDLERILSRVYSNRCSVRVFIDCLNALKKVAQFFTYLEKKVHSKMLKAIVPEGKGSKLENQLNKILDALESEKSLETNEFIVKRGVFPDIDEIDDAVASVDEELQHELKNIKKRLGCREIEFVNMQSEKYQVQIPAKYAHDLDGDFILMSQTKTVRRYHTPEIKELIKKMEDIENERQKLRSGSQKRFIDDFAQMGDIWDSSVDATADIDCLISLANASLRWKANGICRPHFIRKGSDEDNGQAALQLESMRHPCLQVDRVFPNDVNIHDKFVLIITGPNASGKSTYARMCCLAIVLAQIGCYLPANSARLTVYDQIFTRIGASDRLFSGQSTFAVELSETARLMKYATSESFVVLDELGRGTSTFDGIAIASAVLEYFIHKVKCPLVFCTHYHVLAEQFDGYPMVRNTSMKYDVRNELLLFYTLVDGMCSSSFGCKVAKLCGLPIDLTEDAQHVADDFEARHRALHTTGSSVKIEVKEMRMELKEAQEKLQDAVSSSNHTFTQYSRLTQLVMEEINKLDLS